MLALSLKDAIKNVYKWCIRHKAMIAVIIALIIGFFVLEGPHSPYRQEIREFSWFATYWIGLGVASSIGLGTGLHTFVLYLGPHIAMVVLAANECNAIPIFLPSRWKFDHFQECEPLVQTD